MYLWSLYLFFSCIIAMPVLSIQSAVTHGGLGTRLGDSLIAYAHTKWFAYSHKLKLIYQPFMYSDQLMLHHREESYSEKTQELYPYFEPLEWQYDPNNSIERNDTLYEVPWFNHFEYEGTSQRCFCVNWEDQEFIQQLRLDIAPCDPEVAMNVHIPVDRVTIAVHVRRGGGFDSNAVSASLPLKFPPDSYYIEQIQKISQLLGHPRIYVHIFTDDQCPEKIAADYQSVLRLQNIEFGYRKAGNRHDAYVLEDLFAMMKCDCLIMPASSFSFIASKLSTYRIIIIPTHYTLNKGVMLIDQVHITMR